MNVGSKFANMELNHILEIMKCNINSSTDALKTSQKGKIIESNLYKLFYEGSYK